MLPISQTPNVANIPETAWDAKTKVFLSYSRKDRAFAARLSDALEARDDIEVFRDTEDILPTEEWRVRLAKLIGEADTVVFCLSPHSATSEVCGWEVEQAEKLNKRIAPVVVRDVDGKVPGGLAKLNYIFFTERDDFDRALDRLLLALNTDIGWIREHTRLGELSRRWSAGGTPKDQLLRGADIAAAEEWAARQPKTAPEPTGLARLFIAASRTNAVAEARRARRQKLMVGVSATAAAAIARLAYEGVLDQVFLKNQARKYADVHLQTVLKPEVERALKRGASIKECASCPEMIVVPAGEFMMGSAKGTGRGDEYPQHKVLIAQPIAISKFEVTFEEWGACVGHGGCTPDLARAVFGRGQQPAIDVSWDDAQKYAKWLSKLTGQSYRLLSEAEWEYAARAGGNAPFSFGDDEIAMGEYAWFVSNAERKTHAVGTKSPNAFGLYDMLGNVWEWVEDNAHSTYDGAPSDGSAWLGGKGAYRVLRGGFWNSRSEDLRSARRDGDNSSMSSTGYGFRVARTLLPPVP